MKIEEGVMVIKDGKAWGETYSDGHSTDYGWMDLESAPIHNPEFCKHVTDVTYKGSPHIDELNKGELIHVQRITTVLLK